MISNHAQFLAAIGETKLIRIEFYSLPDGGTVSRECAPLDYGAAAAATGGPNRYWIWDFANTAGANPLGLVPEQIVSVQVLGGTFNPGEMGIADRNWILPRSWGPAPGPPGAHPSVPAP